MRLPTEAFRAIVSGEKRGIVPFFLRSGLRMASWPYALGVRWRNRRFDGGRKDIYRASVPVLSVGNLTLGGTGKTPCVEYAAAFYRDLGYTVAILSRGYGGEAGRNDEAMVLEENLPDVPHLQAPDRAALALVAIEELGAEILVLDDGFQHRQLHRDLDVALIDATAPPAEDHLFPRGTLREPVSGLSRAGAIVATRCDQVSLEALAELERWLRDRWPLTPVAWTEHRPLELVGSHGSAPVEELRGRTVGAFCGIGNPTAFRRTLEGLGATIAAFRTFPDHHAYSRSDVNDLRHWASSLPGNASIATTQKDWVKLRVPELAERPVWAVRIGLAFCRGQEQLDAALRGIVPRESDEV